MFSIGELSKQSEVKIPTIRYYEEIGLLAAPLRTEGNQRRYDDAGLERLKFIKHARELGFSVESIASLIELQEHPDRSCLEATEIASTKLSDVRLKIKKLRALEKELARIAKGCDGTNVAQHCYVLTCLANHQYCEHDH